MFCPVLLTSYIAEGCLWFCQHLIQFISSQVKELLQPLHLFLNQTAATRRLVRETHCAHTSVCRWEFAQTCWPYIDIKDDLIYSTSLTTSWIGVWLCCCGDRSIPGIFHAERYTQQKQQCDTWRKQSANALRIKATRRFVVSKWTLLYLSSKMILNCYSPQFTFWWCLICSNLFIS